jgi:hypothetical protein
VSSQSLNLCLPGALLLLAAMLGVSAAADVFGRMPHGPGFRNVRDFGAKGDGVTDDTEAFIRALDEGRGSVREKKPANVYVPPGTYVVSDTLIVWRATMLAGDAEDPPTLVLKDDAPGFGDPQNPKPMVVTALGYNIDPATRDWRTRTNELGGSTNNTFWITVRHLNLRIGKGNPGAWGLYWLVAQQTALRHVTIDAGDAQGCMRSMWWGGGGVISHLQLIGGDYGWHVQETSQWVLRSAEFRRQRKHSLWLDHVWNFSLLDLHFYETAPVRLLGGSVSFIDASFEEVAGDAAIESEGASLILQNVRTRGAKEVVGGLLPARPDGETVVRRWAAGDAVVDGRALPGQTHDLSDTLPGAPEALPSPPYPPMSESVRSVTEFGAKGDGNTDDTAAIQRAIDGCDELFFPEGTYLISDTLRLGRDSRLFGEMWSVIDLKGDSEGFQEPSSRKPMLAVPADRDATLTLCHLRFHMQTPGGTHCDWRAGERSKMIDCTFYSTSETQQLNWRISGEGGGFFENGWNPGKSGDGLEITSSGRKWLYAVQQEHYRGTAVVMRGAKHLTALGFQFETSPNYVLLGDCEDITLFQTIAGNWLDPVPSLIHVVDGRNIALLNSAVTKCETVITEEPDGWNAGPSSDDRGFGQWSVWIAR